MLWVLGLGRVIGPLGELMRGGRALRQFRHMQKFYGELLPAGALVFDVGANLGTMTQVFASVGAKVIAVEPNPDCARHIALTTSQENVMILQAAAAEANGLGILKVSDRKDKMSSFSNEWCEAVAKENEDYVGIWTRELAVPKITLDSLMGRFGTPYYVKIDVEGYEEQVLQGLAAPPHYCRLNLICTSLIRFFGFWSEIFSAMRLSIIHWSILFDSSSRSGWTAAN